MTLRTSIRARLRTAFRAADAWTLESMNPQKVFLCLARHDFRHRSDPRHGPRRPH